MDKLLGAGLKGIKCVVCKKRQSVMTFVNSALDYVHGNGRPMCQRCYDDMVRDSLWYKQGYKEAIEWARDIVRVSGTYKKVKERLGGK